MKDSSLFWTISQRRALIALLLIAVATMAAFAWLRPVRLVELPALGPRSSELADKLNPNTATAAELTNVPELGRVRAQAIVTYRQTMLTAHPDQPAFSTVEDLRNVKGIGPATLEKLRPFMDFDSAPAESK
jgi:competence ComEA-like helix-hairpin-helix protein